MQCATVVVIPTYCESGTIVSVLEQIFATPGHSDLHVLVIDDDSPDGTADRVRDLQDIYANLHLRVRQGARGRGSAVIYGFRALLGDLPAPGALPSPKVIAEMDGDGSHAPAELDGLIARLADSDVVIGSRYVAGGGADLSRPRQLLSTAANFFSQRILGLPYRDCSTGYRCYRPHALRTVDLASLRTDGHATHIELLYRLHGCGVRIVESPIFYRPRQTGVTKAGLREIARVLGSLLRMRLADLRRRVSQTSLS